MTLPFTFAWVNGDQNTFDPNTMNVFDEEILSFQITHEEGQIPTLDLTIRNPRIGLLAPGRKVWGWLAWQTEPDDPDYHGDLVPLFFGVLLGAPNDLFQEKITIRLIARSHDFIAQKQALADAMKVAPYYDPFWFDEANRNDPDAILEGYSALWHVDRTTLQLTASDVLEGEDGTEVFDPDTTFKPIYDSVSLKLGQPPLTTVRMEAKVQWKQRSSGYFTVPTVNVMSYTGESFMSDWPRPGGGLGGGYSVSGSFVNDVYRVAITPTTTWSSNWNNTDPNPGQCSNASASSNSSGPALLSPDPLNNLLTGMYKTGLCDPGADPPLNWPATTSVTGIVVPLWHLQCDMTVRYDAERDYSETLVFEMTADTQGILTSPLVAQETEIITLASVDLSKPFQNIKAWTDFRAQPVAIAQIIFPNDPTVIGGLSHQICVQPGVAGTTQPVFSDFPGDITIDGSVHWASLGLNPLTDATQWQPGAFVPVGQIMNLQDRVFNNATGDYETIPGATSYYMCVTAGQTNGVYHTFTYTPTLTNNDEAPPAPRIISTIEQPQFSQTAGASIPDGSVRWLVLGKNPATLAIPIGGTPDDVRASNFFPTARGLQSLQFLISKVRARLRLRARAVELGWTAPFRCGIPLSCRKSATLVDPRLPGGAATGKIVKYVIRANGDGELRTEIMIGAPVGQSGSPTPLAGTPTYVAEGYVEAGYQVYEGQMDILPDAEDITYTLPVFQPFDDGLRFPLRWEEISDGGRFSGDLDTQKAAIEASFDATRELKYKQYWGPTGQTSQGLTNANVSGISPDQAWHADDVTRAYTNLLTPAVMAANPVSWSALLKPCAGNGPFEGAYAITVSPLHIPKGIDLEAPSSQTP
jgi:hypothetical protein